MSIGVAVGIWDESLVGSVGAVVVDSWVGNIVGFNDGWFVGFDVGSWSLEDDSVGGVVGDGDGQSLSPGQSGATCLEKNRIITMINATW